VIRPLFTRHLTARPGRTALTALAVCLGVAVMLGVQVDLAGVSAEAEAAAGLRAGASGLDVRATGASGLSTDQIADLAALQGVTQVVPLYQKRVIAEAAQPGAVTATVTVVGIQDGGAALRRVTLTAGRLPRASSSDEVALDSGLAQALAPTGRRLAIGGTVMLTTSTGTSGFRVVGLTSASGVSASFTQDAVFMPAAELLRAFPLGLHASLAALQLGPRANAAQVAARARGRLGSTITTFDPASDTGDPLSQVSSLLLLISVLSIVVGAGVTANTVSLAALEGRREIGLLRAAGASAGQVFRLLTSEALVIAAAGAVVGVGAGIGLGAALQAAYGTGQASPVPLRVDWLTALLVALGGIVAATLAAAVPALAAARQPILDALSPETAGRREPLRGWTLGAALPLVALAAVADLGGAGLVPVGAVALLLAILLCLPLVVPPLTRLLARLLRTLLPECEVAAAGLSRNRNRTALTLSGLVTAVAAASACSILVAGSSSAADQWVDHLFIGDTLVRSPVTEHPAVASQLSQLAGVEVTPLRFFPAVVDSDVIGVVALDSRAQEAGGAFQMVAGDRGDAFAALRGGANLLAPSVLADADDWQVGTELPVSTPTGTVIFRVAGILEHSFPAADGRESLVIDNREAVRVFGSDADGFDDLEVLSPGRGADVVRTASRYGLSATPVSAIRAAVESALGSTIGILPALSWITVIIAMLALITTVSVSVRSGRRELALLRVVGLSASQIRRFVLAQAGFLGVAAALVGTGVGCLLALPMLQAGASPGFAPAFALPALTVVVVAAGVVASAVAAAVLPARRAAQADIVSAVQRV